MSVIETKQTAEIPYITTSEEGQQSKNGTFSQLLQSRNFVLMWIGEAISLIGDQFYMIALPWLTLQLTNDPFAMGTVLAVGGIPRALFMLVGGALTDRFTSRSIMLLSNLARMALVLLLTFTVLAGMIQVWMLFIFALVFGLLDALFFPAQASIVPHLVKPEQLQSANAIVMMTQQLSLFGGPILAGALIALFSTSATETDLTGIGMAFGIDSLTFFASAITLWFIKMQPIKPADNDDSTNMIAAIREGLHYVRNNITLRSVFTLIIFANVLIVAPMTVGIPVLADSRLAEGAAAFGIIMSAFGGGTVIGMIFGGALPRPSDKRFGIVIISVWSMMGLCIAMMGIADTTAMAALLGALMGISNGYVSIVFLTWLQSNTPQAMLGRMMSLFGFATVGLSPIANALLGALVGVNLTMTFVGAGLLMTALVLGAMLLSPALRNMQMTTIPATQ